MRTSNRRTAMKVHSGRVFRKNNWRPHRDDYFAVPQTDIRIDRHDPGRGYRHLITVAQLRAFVALLPDWDDIAIGLRAIVLDSGEDDLMGWHDRGIVAVCAWEQPLWWTDAHPEFVAEHEDLLELHHHDRMTTRSQRNTARGESYAERYANRVMDELWPSYARTFGL